MSGARILVVEDESIVALDIKMTLQRLGYTVVGVATTADDAVRMAEELRPDVVLTDIMLKGKGDGIQAAQAIRDRLDIPVVFLTAHADDATRRRAEGTGASGYVLKPFEGSDLEAPIATALHQHRLRRLPPGSPAARKVQEDSDASSTTKSPSPGGEPPPTA